MMTLHHSPTSPYVRKVMVVLHETGQLDSVRLVPGSGTPVAPAQSLLGTNPLGKVPALEREDGCALYDSRVICRYLASLSPKGAGLYPAVPALWEALTLESTADGILDAALLMRYETVLRAPPQQAADWVEGQWGKVTRALSVLEQRWMAHLEGPLTIGVIATGCALSYLDFRFAERDWAAQHPALATWSVRFGARDSMQATRPE